MINGTVYRATHSQLVKATSTGSSGLTKQGNIVKSKMFQLKLGRSPGWHFDPILIHLSI